MDVEDFDYYSDSNGMVHCGYHIDKKAQYINITQICDVNDRLLCKECYLFLKKHTQTFEEEQFVSIDDVFDENFRFLGLKHISKQLEQLDNLEKVQIAYMNEMERFYEDIKRDVNDQIDQCKKKMLCLFNIQLEEQNIFKEQLEQLLHFDQFRYFVRSMSNHSLECRDIELFIQEQYRMAQILDEVAQNYIYSPDMIAFFSQIEQLKKVKKANKLKEYINDISVSQNCNQLLSNNNNYQFINRQLFEQIQELDAKLQPQVKRKNSLDEQLLQIEKQKQRVMDIQQEKYEDCDMFFLYSILEQSKNIQMNRELISSSHPLGLPNEYNVQTITIPSLTKCQIFSSSPLINSQTYEFNLEFLNQPTGDCSVGVVEEKKKNQQIPPNLSKTIFKKSENNSEQRISNEEILKSSFLSSPNLPNQIVQCNVRVNISKKSLIIYNQHYKQTIELQNVNNQTNYRLALTLSQQSENLIFRLNGVKIIY